MKNYDAPEDWDRLKKYYSRKNKTSERQAKAEARAAYLRGEKSISINGRKQRLRH